MKGCRMRSACRSQIAARWNSTRDKGLAFVATLGLFFAMAILIAAVLQGNVTQRRAFRNRRDRIEVRYMAESALHEALHALSRERKSGGLDRSFGRGEAVATWTVASDAEAVIEIAAVSRTDVPGAAKRDLRVRVHFDAQTGRATVVARE